MAESASFAIPALAPAPVPSATYGARDFARAIGSLLPRGRAWSTDPQSLIGQVLASIAPEFARVQARADTLLVELDPSRATELLPEHETANGLPDACSPVIDSLHNRRAALLAKLAENRGHAEPDYLSILAELGATAALYRSPYRVTRAGLARVGDRVQGEPWAFVFAVAYMANLVASPNEQTAWSTLNGQWNGLDYNAAVAPDGTTTADKLSVIQSTETWQSIATTAGATGVQWSIWLRSESGSPVPLALRVTIGLAQVEVPIEVGSAWRRFVVRAEVPTSTTAELRIRNTDSGVIGTRKVWAWGSYAGLISHTVECRMRRIMRAHVEADFRVLGDAIYASTAPQ